MANAIRRFSTVEKTVVVTEQIQTGVILELNQLEAQVLRTFLGGSHCAKILESIFTALKPFTKKIDVPDNLDTYISVKRLEDKVTEIMGKPEKEVKTQC
jgi:hypothetical protein